MGLILYSSRVATQAGGSVIYEESEESGGVSGSFRVGGFDWCVIT